MTPVKPDFMDLRTRAELLDLCDDQEAAEALRVRSLEIARETDLICYSYQLLWRNRTSEAIELLELCVSRHRHSWNAWDSLGDAYAQKGDIRRSGECYGHASRLVTDDDNRLRIEQHLRDLLALGALAS